MGKRVGLAFIFLALAVYITCIRIPDMFGNSTDNGDVNLLALTWGYLGVLLLCLIMPVIILARSNKALLTSVISPLISCLFILIVGGGLGLSFILLGETFLGEVGAMVIGMLLVIFVPITALTLSMSKY